MSTLTMAIQHGTGSCSWHNKLRKRNKRHTDETRTKLFLIADTIFYIKYPKEFTKKLLELIIEFSEVTRYKIKTQKSIAFLYSNNEYMITKIKNAIPFTITQKI